jgi:hypothetical protein
MPAIIADPAAAGLTNRERAADIPVMDQVSRPFQVVLLVTVLFAAVWLVALRPRGGGGEETAAAPEPAQALAVEHGSAAAGAPADGAGGSASGPQAGQPSVASGGADDRRGSERPAAPRAVGPGRAGRAAARPATSRATPSRAQGDERTGRAAARPATSRATPSDATGEERASAAATPAARRLATARAALDARRTLVLSFVDREAADSRSVARELDAVGRFGGRVTAVAVPIAELARYGFVTRGVDVTTAPTTVVVDPRRRATTIVGFADRAELAQHVADALR